jgi:hypothetical protein
MNIRRYFGLVALTGALTLGAFIPTLAHAAPSTRQTAPLTARTATGDDTVLMQVACNEPGVLHLFSELGFRGSEICFSGVGCVNLTDFQFYPFLPAFISSWNDTVQSYRSDMHMPVEIFQDINQGGDSRILAIDKPVEGDLPDYWQKQASTLCVGADYVNQF